MAAVVEASEAIGDAQLFQALIRTLQCHGAFLNFAVELFVHGQLHIQQARLRGDPQLPFLVHLVGERERQQCDLNDKTDRQQHVRAPGGR